MITKEMIDREFEQDLIPFDCNNCAFSHNSYCPEDRHSCFWLNEEDVAIADIITKNIFYHLADKNVQTQPDQLLLCSAARHPDSVNKNADSSAQEPGGKG